MKSDLDLCHVPVQVQGLLRDRPAQVSEQDQRNHAETLAGHVQPRPGRGHRRGRLTHTSV